MKRQLPTIIIIALGWFMLLQYLVPHETSEFYFEFLLEWAPIIGTFALMLGIISLVRMSVIKVKRKQEDWQYSIITLVGLATIMVIGFTTGSNPEAPVEVWGMTLGGGQNAPAVRWIFQNMIIPVSATMFSLLAFFIASAAFRSFRARSVLATILLVAAIIVMLRFFPLGPFSEFETSLSRWILNVPNLAAKRAIIMGVGLGIVSTALKIILGIERSFLGRD